MEGIYIQCAQAIASFYRGLDQADLEGLLRCVEEETVWHRQGKTLVGPDEIRHALEERNPDRVTSHQLSNLIVEQIDDITAVATYYLTVYDNMAPSGGLQLKTILRSTDRFAKQGDSWRLTEKRSAKHL
ncbi:MAG: nuclear transport factor 2 family protein [Pusillimonas sp.]